MRGRVHLAAVAVLLVFCACRKTPAPISPQQAADLRRPASEWLTIEAVRLLSDYVRLDTTAA
ncbi:MAG TPA: hypothetical protein VGG65_07200, partial [Thermoanaerobaculia bacterium]